jgi:hypothetical protein
MGAWWRMRLYLSAEKVSYSQMPEDETFSKLYDDAYVDEEDEDNDGDDEEEEHIEAMGEIVPMSWYLERAEQGDLVSSEEATILALEEAPKYEKSMPIF